MSSAKLFPHKEDIYHRCKYAIETALAYTIYGFFRILPLKLASDTGAALLGFIGPHMAKSRKVVLRNLDAAFPEKSADEKDQIMRGVWRNLGRVIAEYAHLHEIWKNVEFVGVHHFDDIRQSGQPVIFFGGHLANWEVCSISAKQHGLPIHLVYRRPNNPWVDGLLRHARRSGADGHIEKGMSGAREIMSILKKGEHVGMLVDQKLNEGMPIPFFGRDAMTAEAVALFALKLKCKLYPTRIERTHGVHFRFSIYPPLHVENTGDREKDVRKVLTDINMLLESWIRERPEQWLWTHRRWPKDT